MIYVLMLWSTVAAAGDRHGHKEYKDWRPLAEFHSSVDNTDVLKKCEAAILHLGINKERARCVRTK